jgi:PAS domain S-box-containing protein
MMVMRSPAGFVGDVQGALEGVAVPTYMTDRSGVIRWLNAAARELVGDARGRQFTSVVAPEDTRRARESFTRKVFGLERSTEASAVLIGREGERVTVEINSVPLREGQTIVGVFGLIPRHVGTPPARQHAHLTPRQLEILQRLAHGQSTVQIAADLNVAVQTVRNHVRRLLRALGVHSRLEALAVARRDGLLAE